MSEYEPPVFRSRPAELFFFVERDNYILPTIVQALCAERTRVEWRARYATLLDFDELRVSLWCGGLFSSWRQRRPRGDIISTAQLILGGITYIEAFEVVWAIYERIKRGELEFNVRFTPLGDADFNPEQIALLRELLEGSALLTNAWRTGPTVRKLWRAIPELGAIFDYEAAFRDFLDRRGWVRNFSGEGTRVCLSGGGKRGRPKKPLGFPSRDDSIHKEVA